MLLDEAPRAVALLDVRHAPDHVHLGMDRAVDAVDRPDDRGPGLLGARQQRVEPAGGHDHVVVEKQHVRGVHLLEAHVPRAVG